MGCENVAWVHVAQNGDQWLCSVNMVMSLLFPLKVGISWQAKRLQLYSVELVK